MPSKVIGKLHMDNELLQKDLDTIAQFPVLDEAYPEFGVGTWKNHSLWNKTGDYRDMQVQDSNVPAKATEFGQALPYIHQLIHETFDVSYLRMARVRNLVDGVVFPHRDFIELSRPKNQYLRVFVPLQNNAQAFHSDETHVFQMQKNEIWQLDAALTHSAANFGTDNRMHLCMDFQFSNSDFSLESIFLDPRQMEDLPKPTLAIRGDLNDLQARLSSLAEDMSQDKIFDALVVLSKLHFKYNVGVADCYDWLISIAEQTGSHDLIQTCRNLKTFMLEKRMLGESFSFHAH